MKQVIRAEFYYLSKSFKLWIYLGIFVICSVVNTIMTKNPGLSISLFVISTLLVSELTHKDGDKTTLKNIAGSGITYGEIFRAKCAVAIIVGVSMLVVTTVAGIIGNLITDPDGIVWSEVLLRFLTRFANYFIILIVGELTGSVAGTIVLSILITGALPVFFYFMSGGQSAMSKLCDKIYPFTLDGLSEDPMKIAIPKYFLVIGIIAVLLFLCEKHYVKKHYN